MSNHSVDVTDDTAQPVTTNITTAPSPLRTSLVTIGFTVLAVSFMVNAMDRQMFYPMLPNIAEAYGFSLSQGGLLATGFTLGMALAGLPAGYLMDRYSRKAVLLISIVIYSAGTLATPLARGFADMVVYRLISGFGEGMQAAALFAAIGAYFFHRRGFAFGLLGAAFGVGVFIGPLAGTQLATVQGTWRAPFVLFGLCGLVVTLIAVFTVRKSLTERTTGGGTKTAAESFDHVPASPYNRNSIALAAASAVGGMVFYGFIGLYPTYLRTVLNLEPGQAAFAASCVGFGSIMSIPAGWLGDRFDQRKILMGTFLMISVSGWLIYNGPTTAGWQYLLAFVMGTFSSGFLYTTCQTVMQRAVRPEYVGRGAGMFVTTYYAAAAGSGLLFATLVDAIGWSGAGLWQLTILPLVGLIALAFVDTSRFNNAKASA
ncbi:MFS transporter [Streptomyces sp. NPDC000880]